MKKKEIGYYECQHVFHLKCCYIWILWLGMDGLFIYGFVRQIIFREPWGNNPMPDTGLIITAALVLGCSLLFVFMRLETVIDAEGCSVRYFPLLWRYRTVAWENVEKAYVRKYSPIREYGGWGMKSGGFRIKKLMLRPLRMPFESSKAYTLYGNTGLQLELKNGNKVLIGTQHPQEIEEILKLIKVQR